MLSGRRGEGGCQGGGMEEGRVDVEWGDERGKGGYQGGGMEEGWVGK